MGSVSWYFLATTLWTSRSECVSLHFASSGSPGDFLAWHSPMSDTTPFAVLMAARHDVASEPGAMYKKHICANQYKSMDKEWLGCDLEHSSNPCAQCKRAQHFPRSCAKATWHTRRHIPFHMLAWDRTCSFTYLHTCTCLSYKDTLYFLYIGPFSRYIVCADMVEKPRHMHIAHAKLVNINMTMQVFL